MFQLTLGFQTCHTPLYESTEDLNSGPDVEQVLIPTELLPWPRLHLLSRLPLSTFCLSFSVSYFCFPPCMMTQGKLCCLEYKTREKKDFGVGVRPFIANYKRESNRTLPKDDAEPYMGLKCS